MQTGKNLQFWFWLYWTQLSACLVFQVLAFPTPTDSSLRSLVYFYQILWFCIAEWNLSVLHFLLSALCTLWILPLHLLEGWDAREFLFIALSFLMDSYVPSINWPSVPQYGISGILIQFVFLGHSFTLGPMCLIFSTYILDKNIFLTFQNKHFCLIFHSSSSRIYYISSSEMLGCLCFFPLLVLLFF